MLPCEMLLHTAEVISGPALRATAMTLKLLDTTLSEKWLLNLYSSVLCSRRAENKEKCFHTRFSAGAQTGFQYL